VLGIRQGFHVLAGVSGEATGSRVGSDEGKRLGPRLKSRLPSQTHRGGERAEARDEHCDAPYKKESRCTVFTPSYRGNASDSHEGSIAAHARAETASGISEKTPLTDPAA